MYSSGRAAVAYAPSRSGKWSNGLDPAHDDFRRFEYGVPPAKNGDYARMVPLAEIASEVNDYNLNMPRYIDSSEPEELHDLSAHLHGGIPNRDIDALGAYWKVFPALRQRLFSPNGREG